MKNIKLKKITKAIIPVAGLGTRFLPWSKNIPKEMLPILNKPTIQYIVEEAVASGIEEILFVTSDSKEALVDHFDRHLFLEDSLIKKKKLLIVEELRKISSLAKIYTVRQDEPKGLGHAVLQAKSFIGNEPFALLLGDDVNYSGNNKPVLKQMINVFEQYNSSILGVQKVPKDDIEKYGIIDFDKKINSNLFSVKKLVEKPPKNKAPSNLAICGRYILTPKIFKFLEEQNIDLNTNEIQITDSIDRLSKIEKVFAFTYKAKRYDLGSKEGFIEANIEYALRDKGLRNNVLKILEKELSNSKKKKINSK